MTTSTPIRRAATVILLRREGSAFSVFLVQRSRRVGFMPSAWVFPGGRVDDADRLEAHPGVTGGESAAARMELAFEDGLPFLVAAVRETFEESGIWLGSGKATSEGRDRLNADQVTVGELMLQEDLGIDLDRVIPFSWWITPEAESRRYDTRFFVALVEDVEARHDDGETVASAWVELSEAVDKAERGEFPMAPPTWWTLTQLAAAAKSGWQGILDVAQPGRAICPILTKTPDGLELVLPGDPEHERERIPGLPTRIGFAQGHWWSR